MSAGTQTFSAEALVPGQRVRLLALETTKSKWTSVLIGCRPGRYLVIEVPRVNGLPIVLEERSQWSINFINRGQIYYFSSEIIASISRPFALAFLSWPAKVEISNLRTDKRYPVNIPVTMHQAEGSCEIVAKGLLLDLSWGGCLAASTVELPDQMPLAMTMYLDSNNIIEGLLVEKKGSRIQQGTFYTGLSFMTTNKSEIMDRLTEFLSDIESIPLRL
ncbi:MAG: flagellar brake protein [Deltaproteobacteria bacterium]|jgi:c-di-GMP-binding flagellar brake protein YcgR|nr:flagellar brake protein [Deltaproteobacteria bacterium]